MVSDNSACSGTHGWTAMAEISVTGTEAVRRGALHAGR